MTYRVCNHKTTFKVHEVQPAEQLLEEALTGDVLVSLLAEYDRASITPMLSWSDYNSKSVKKLECHPFFAAVHKAFSEHRPLVISPDMIWIIIVQGLSQHIRNNANSLRSKMVFHSDRMRLSATVGRIHPGSPETAWDECVSALRDSLRANVVGSLDDLRCDFSTTGDIERTACDIALLDAFEPYFDYNLYSVCGFPSITLEGTANDWQQICDKIELLTKYEIDWWLDALREVAKNFANAAAGNVDLSVWRNMYKREDRYGATKINGWILKLIPYIRGEDLLFTQINPLLFSDMETTQDDNERMSEFLITSMLPSGISCVPFTLHELQDNQNTTSRLQLLGGFTGVEQDAETLSLRPRIGWAVRRNPMTNWIPESTISGCKILEPIPLEEYDQIIRTVGIKMRFGFVVIPNDFANFYRQCDGIEFENESPESHRARIYRMQDLTFEDEDDDDYIDSVSDVGNEYETTRIRVGLPERLITFAELADGSTVVHLVGSSGSMRNPPVIFKVDAAGNRTPLAAEMTEFCEKFMTARGNL